MGRSEVEKKIEATLCPNCSFEHVVVPMFRSKSDLYHCLLCKNSFKKRVNGKTVFVMVEPEPAVEFEADFEV